MDIFCHMTLRQGVLIYRIVMVYTLEQIITCYYLLFYI